MNTRTDAAITGAAADVAAVLQVELASILDCPPEMVDLSARMVELPGIDSLKLVQTVVLCEQRWQVQLDEEQLFEVRTGLDLCELIRSTMAAGGRQ